MLSRGLLYVHRNFTAEKGRSSRQTAHRNRTSAGRPPAISRIFFFFPFQLRQKLATCSLSDGDPITTLKSLPVTMLIRSYLHMRPQKSKANCPLPYLLFLTRFPKIVHSPGGLVRHFQTVKVVQERFLELQLKCPRWERINWQRKRKDTPSWIALECEASFYDVRKQPVISTLISPLSVNSRLFEGSAKFERNRKWQTASVFLQPEPMLESMSSFLFCCLKERVGTFFNLPHLWSSWAREEKYH